jgi:hypothetical protein
MEPTFETILEDARAGVRVQLARQTVEPERVAQGYRVAASASPSLAGGALRACVVSPDQAQMLRLLGAVDVLRATID